MSGIAENAPCSNRLAGKWLAASIMLGVCALSGYAQQDEAAKVIALNGQVSALRDKAPWALNLGDAVKPGQLIVTGIDGYALLEVADGSTFEVFPSSRVVFRDNPGNWKDLLEVFLGRVKIQIQKIGGQPNYNKVRTPTAVISVRGTIFDVSVEDEDGTTQVVVEEGQVEVRHSLLPSGTKTLNSGEWIRIYKNQPLAAKSVDKGGILRGAMRAAADAVYEVIYRTPRTPTGSVGAPGGGGSTGGTGGGSSSGGVGDKGNGNGNAPPPPPPPPPH